MIKKYYILIIFFLIVQSTGFSQDGDFKIGQRYEPVYSQYDVNGLAINPAYTGSRECFSNIILYRNQWIGFEGAPVTQTLSSHAPFKDEKNAVGVFIFHEQIGVSDYYDVYGNYAFRFQFGNGKLSLGLKAGATFFQGNFADINASPDETQTDPLLNNESEFFPNFGVGAYYYNEDYYFGISVPKFLSYELKNSQKYMSLGPSNYDFLVTGGYLIRFSENLQVKPSFLLRYRLDNSFQIDAGANLILFNAIWFGGSYRRSDEIVIMAEYQVNHQIRAGVAYDLGIGDFSSQHSGSLEIILRYDFKYKVKAVSPRYF
ncbi:MAG: type IX secretion system membrane protein PorP/SprF [Bacteroidales bacterium]|nr:type IX secretion system membrane protein PorP/SprF [Bacteroidales bacterium]